MISYIICDSCKEYTETKSWENACVQAFIHNIEKHKGHLLASTGQYKEGTKDWHHEWHPYWWGHTHPKCYECGDLSVVQENNKARCKKHLSSPIV